MVEGLLNRAFFFLFSELITRTCTVQRLQYTTEAALLAYLHVVLEDAGWKGLCGACGGGKRYEKASKE